MRLNELTLQHYRNYETVSLDFPKTLNLFLGENAQGKTNLLESIYVLAMTRSHRTSNEKELIGWEQAAAKISGVVEKKTGTVPLEILISNKGHWATECYFICPRRFIFGERLTSSPPEIY